MWGTWRCGVRFLGYEVRVLKLELRTQADEKAGEMRMATHCKAMSRRPHEYSMPVIVVMLDFMINVYGSI